MTTDVTTARPFPNRLGIHALVWTGSWDTDELDRAMGRSAELGYDIIEIPRFDPTKVDARWFRSRLDAHGLDVVITSALAWDADISSADAAVAKRGETMLLEIVDVTADLGALLLGGILFSALGKYPSGPTAAGRDNVVAALTKAGERASAAGLPVALELVNRYESNVLNTVAQGMSMLDDVGSEALSLHLDTYHMNIEETDTAAAIRLAGDRLGYFHVGDSHRGYAGTGQIDFDPIFTALVDIGYQGAITFESFSSEVLDEGLSNDIAIWRNTWRDSAAVASHAYAFLTERMSAAHARHAMLTGAQVDRPRQTT